MPAAAALCCLLLLSASVAQADEGWPQFRGPSGQGISTAKNVRLKWTDKGPFVWETEIPGRGWSSPVALAGQVWVTTALEEGPSLRAVSVDLKTGKIRHNVEVFAPAEPAPLNKKNSYASPTAVLEPGRVYVHFGTMGTACLDTETGEVLWRNDKLTLDHKEGPGSSPILYKNLLIVNCDGMDVQYVTALDKQTGEQVWKTNRSAPLREKDDLKKAYSTPLLTPTATGMQLISTGADQVQGYDPETGRELWQVRYSGFSNVPRPVALNGTVFVCTGFTQPQLWAIRTDGSGNVTDSHVEWKFARQVPANSSPLLVDGRIYLVSDKGVCTCVNAASGEQVWQDRLGGNYSASPVYADGRIYCCSEEGTVSVIATGDEFKILAANEMNSPIFASPAILDNNLLLRTERQLLLVAGER